MTSNKNLLESFKETDGGQVIFGNNQTCKVQGIRSIRLMIQDRNQVILQDVRYVPKLKRNLISLGTLDKSSYSFEAEKGILTVHEDTKIVMKGMRSNGLYILNGATLVWSVNQVDKEQESSMLWQIRMAHSCEKGLMQLHKQGLLENKSMKHLDFCEDCIRGKSTRIKFNKGTHISSAPMDYAHSVIFGNHQGFHPMEVLAFHIHH